MTCSYIAALGTFLPIGAGSPGRPKRPRARLFKDQDPQTYSGVWRTSAASARSGLRGRSCRKIFDYHKLEPRRFWTALLEDDVGRFDSEAVVILSLALGARDSARLVRGSNPIWYRKTSDGRDADASDLKAAAIRWGTSIVRDLVSASSIDRNGIKIINTDFNSDQLKGAFDFCLTSPPYLNRLDYVVAHLPELAVLQLITSVDIERLRSAMIGTTKIVAKDESPVPVDWGPTCLQTLRGRFERIE
jgi:hypothetical protein